MLRSVKPILLMNSVWVNFLIKKYFHLLFLVKHILKCMRVSYSYGVFLVDLILKCVRGKECILL